MLTQIETQNTRRELRENFARLGYPMERVTRDTRMTEDEIQAVLDMEGARPSQVWELRDYLEDMLDAEGIEMEPFTALADHGANRWYPYETPWRGQYVADEDGGEQFLLQ